MTDQVTYKVTQDNAVPPRNRLVRADRVRATSCVHGRTFTPLGYTDVTVCPRCEAEIKMMENAKS